MKTAIAEIESAKAVIKDQAKRISELESALIEERAKLLYFAHVGDGEYCPDVIDEADRLKDRHLENAREDLHLEGKI